MSRELVTLGFAKLRRCDQCTDAIPAASQLNFYGHLLQLASIARFPPREIFSRMIIFRFACKDFGDNRSFWNSHVGKDHEICSSSGIIRCYLDRPQHFFGPVLNSKRPLCKFSAFSRMSRMRSPTVGIATKPMRIECSSTPFLCDFSNSSTDLFARLSE